MKSLCLATCSLVATLAASPALATFLPPNDLHLEDSLDRKDANMTQAQFDKVIEGVESVYDPIAATHNANLTIQHRWTDATVNANASQSGNAWNVNMYGGLARRPEVTRDGFAAVVCHELGHHLGGYTYYDGASNWAASEGQSDYFATHACLPKIWANDDEVNATFRAQVDPLVKRSCDGVWRTEKRQNLCYRINAAGESLARLLAALGNSGVPRFDTPDPSEVSSTSTSHPAAQCRLDTYFQASLCTRAFQDLVIPARNLPAGQNSQEAEALSMETTCHSANGFSVGLRPRCWYKPTLEFRALAKGSIDVLEAEGNGNGVAEPGETVALKVQVNNASNQAARDITMDVSTLTEGVTIQDGQSTYPNLEPGTQAVNAEPLTFTLADDMACGARVDLTMHAVADVGEASWTHDFFLGREAQANLGAAAPNLRIPDNNPTGIRSSITSEKAGPVQKVLVTVDITHTYIGDLTVKLVAPNGAEVILSNRAGGGADDIKKTFEVPMAVADGAGEWTLVVIDSANSDTGTLNAWSLKAVQAVCE
jgi:hypothetical protein